MLAEKNLTKKSLRLQFKMSADFKVGSLGGASNVEKLLTDTAYKLQYHSAQ